MGRNLFRLPIGPGTKGRTGARADSAHAMEEKTEMGVCQTSAEPPSTTLTPKQPPHRKCRADTLTQRRTCPARMEAFRGWNAPDNEIANATRVAFICTAQCACQSDVARFLTGRYCGVSGGPDGGRGQAPICSFVLLDDPRKLRDRLRCAHGILNVSRPLSGPLLGPRYASRENTG